MDLLNEGPLQPKSFALAASDSPNVDNEFGFDRHGATSPIPTTEVSASNASDEKVEEKRRNLNDLLQQANRDVQMIGNLHDKLDAAKQQICYLKACIADVEQKLGRRISCLERQNQSLQNEFGQTLTLLDQEHQNHHETRRKLENRTEEWHSAQAFLVMNDTVSGADVTKLVIDLNEEIFQISASMAEWIVACNPGSFEPGIAAQEAASEIIGIQMVEALLCHDGPSDESREIVIQASLRLTLASRCFRQLHVMFSHSVETNESLVEIYEIMRQTELPAVSGRWRALTRSKTKPELIVQTLVQDFIESIVLVSRLCLDQEWLQSFSAKFSEKLIPVATMVKRLDKTIGEGVTSQDLTVFLPLPGEAFDVHSMIDVNEVPRRRSKLSRSSGFGSVVCTITLGLLCRSWKAIDGQSLPQSSVLLKAQVQLDSNVAW